MLSAATRLQEAASLREFCQVAAVELRRITGLDRVMVYRFHPDDTGEVFSESRREDMPSWLGLRYPPHDIPKPARDIFRKIWVRPVPDAAAKLAELVPLASPDTGQPLDMTYCALRGASVMYTEYLANMGVAASLTLSMRRDDELWGLIACHHERPTPLPPLMRAACEFLAQIISLRLRHVEDHELLEYRQQMDATHHALVARTAGEGGLVALGANVGLLLSGVEAGGAAICHRDRWWTTGVTPSEDQLAALASWLRERSPLASGGEVYATDHLSADFPAAAAYAAVASGLLVAQLAPRRSHMILWFRPETVRTVHWAGNPHDMPMVTGPHGPRLTPRRSFELWREVVRGRSSPWLVVEVDAARRLRRLVADLVVVHAEQLAELNAELASRADELSTFAYITSHDLKEPLRGIRRQSEQLLAELEDLASPGLQAAARVEAILRLTARMESLLDSLLRFSWIRSAGLELEEMEVSDVLREALEMLGVRVAESRAEIRIPRRLPALRCDRLRLREVLANLVSNAIKYNDHADRWVEIGYIDPSEPPPDFFRAELRPAEARGQVALYVRDNGIGIEARHFEQVFRMFKRLHGRDAYEGGSGAGLAIVKKVIAQHGGCLWLDSSVGVGSIFFFTLASTQA